MAKGHAEKKETLFRLGGTTLREARDERCNLLMREGALVECVLDVDSKMKDTLRRASQPAREPVRGMMIIDTGAGRTVIDDDIVAKPLELNAHGRVQTSVAGGRGHAVKYVLSLSLPGRGIKPLGRVRVYGMHFKRKGAIGLIGRDVLREGRLVYDGRKGAWSLRRRAWWQRFWS